MNNVSSGLQKVIQDNLSRLNMPNNTQVMCSCSLIGSPLTDATGPTGQPTAIVTVTPDFVPGVLDNGGKLHPSDIGNAPFIFPQGVTPDSILQEQSAALAPIVKAAEEQAAAAAQRQVHLTTATTIVTTETPSTIVSMESLTPMTMPTTMTMPTATPTTMTMPTATPTTMTMPTATPTAMTMQTATPTTVTMQTATPTTITVEKFAPVHSSLSSYRDIESPHSCDYPCTHKRHFPNPNLFNGSNYGAYYGSDEQYGGYAPPYDAQDYIVQIAGEPECAGFFFSSWLLYIICMAVLLYLVVTQFNLF